METFIKRVYGFNVADVREAITKMLSDRRVTIPPGHSMSTAKFILTPAGATLEWEEQSEN